VTRTRGLGLAVLCISLVVMHYAVRPLLGTRATVDFLAAGVLLAAVRTRPGAAAIVGCAAGLVADAMAPSSFGAAMLAFTVVGGAASWLKATFFGENITLDAMFVLGGKLAFDAIFMLTERRLSTGDAMMHLVTWSALSALLTAVAGVVALVVFRPLLQPRVGELS
jgi:rod shape-determining protein MreD